MSDNANFPMTAAELVGNWCGTLFYGIYLVTCTFAARTLFLVGRGRGERWLRRNEIRWLLVSFAAAFFVFITFNLALATYHIYVAFIFSEGPNGALKELQNPTNWVNVARCISVFLTMQLGDFILIYRCWIVYARRWLIIAPSIVIWLAGFAMGLRTIQLSVVPVTVQNPNLVALGSEVALWSLIIFILASVQNILSTGLLVFRIWKVDREIEACMGERQSGHLRRVMVIIMESGAFYTTSVMLCLIMAAIHSNGFYPMTHILLVSAGIANNTILVFTSTSRDERFKSFNEHSTFRAAEGPATTISGFMQSQSDNVYDLSGNKGIKTEKDSAIESEPSV